MQLYKILLLGIVVILILAIFTFKQMNMESKEDSGMFQHSATMNIEILEKYKQEEGVTKYFLESQNINEPYQSFFVEVKDENTWNLIEAGGQYFIHVSWETEINDISIQDKTTVLLQIDKL